MIYAINTFMNSKQLNFFIVPDDSNDIYSLFNRNSIKYINTSESSIDKIILDTFPYRGKLFEKIYLTCDDFCPNIFMKYDNLTNAYIIDNYKSPLLEFDR